MVYITTNIKHIFKKGWIYRLH